MNTAVTLEPWGSGDLPLLERLMGDPRMTEHLGGPESANKLRERQDRYVRLEGGDRMFKIIDVASVAGAGSVGFWTKEWRNEQVYEVGWMVLPEFHGRGIAMAATAQAIALAKHEDKHRFMHAFPSVNNAPSNAICRRLGFELLEVCEFEFPKGHFMTCNDWRLDLLPISKPMEPHINVITLAVGDLDRSLAFYRDGLGLETTGVVATEVIDEETSAAGAIVIFRLKGGLVLALYPRSELAKDAGIPFGAPKTGEFSIGQLVESRPEVDALSNGSSAPDSVVAMLRFQATLRSDTRGRVYLPLPGEPEVRHLAGTVDGMRYRGAVESIDGSPVPGQRRREVLDAGADRLEDPWGQGHPDLLRRWPQRLP